MNQKHIKALEQIAKTEVPTHPRLIFDNGKLYKLMSWRTFQRLIVDLKEKGLIEATVSSEGRNKGKKYFITSIQREKINSLIEKLIDKKLGEKEAKKEEIDSNA